MRTGISITLNNTDRRRLKHGVFCSVAERNETEAKSFIWRADPDAFIAARTRGVQALEATG